MSDYKVLIVEDELLVSADIEESLEILGYNVVGAVATGKDAIESVEKHLPDVILMDIMLKGDMTGIEAANIIRKKHDVPIIYLTANADIATIEKAKISLPYGYIIKPFTEKDLQTNIEIARFKFSNDIQAKMESDQYNRFFNDVNSGKTSIFIESDSGLDKIKTGDIYYIDSNDDGSLIVLPDEDIAVSKSVEELEKELPDDQFIKVNQNQIVNVRKVFLSTLPEIIIADKMNVIIVDDDRLDQVKAKLESR
jgi:DNA-binding LytR/AlgR family response regulator